MSDTDILYVSDLPDASLRVFGPNMFLIPVYVILLNETQELFYWSGLIHSFECLSL